MHSIIVAAALVGAAAAQQAFDPSMINAATTPIFTQAPYNAEAQTLAYNAASASATGSAAAASASATGAKFRRQASGVATNTPSSTAASASACPTQPEAGTYCGFINPEDACAKQPDGYGPVPTPDTPAAFLAYPPFHQMAQGAKTPQGYVETFKDLNASSSANSYLGLHTLSSYDVIGCSQLCDNTTLCTAFNIYIERDPSINPAANCTNPPSITNYKCTLWGSGLEAATATNTGEYRDGFQVVITGSDGFDKTNNTTPSTPGGCGAPSKCSGGSGIIHAPDSCVGTKFFPGCFDLNICAGFALAQNTLASQSYGHGSQQCKEVNAYMIKKNGVAQGTVCALYTQAFDHSFGTYQPGWQGQHFWGVESSCVMTIDPQQEAPNQKPWWQWW